MKKSLLICGLLLLPALSMAQANLVHGVSALTNAALRKKNTAHRPASHGKKEVVKHFRAGNKSIPQKRTPAAYLDGPAASTISGVEGFLDATYKAYKNPQESNICANSALVTSMINSIEAAEPKWNTAPYKAELAFYEQEHKRRQQAVAQPQPNGQ
ncbi:hypothetical protein FY528_18865 [Hymenobacter lutimineralis]|uniref:Uncharacterized protein n=1 Tax=Hymenobacter lutimineralis TaxID=2606448 RepID=A0A5D6UT04_9BACT|nr:hypothetical protein [Hymenobacter lutimineralis]TYZ06200.1 hypothetical protein FY528_18865 [Hymenobacter lutimineralis]